MLKENFELALKIAIRAREENETRSDPHFKSGFRAGLEEILKASQNGESIEIKELPTIMH